MSFLEGMFPVPQGGYHASVDVLIDAVRKADRAGDGRYREALLLTRQTLAAAERAQAPDPSIDPRPPQSLGVDRVRHA